MKASTSDMCQAIVERYLAGDTDAINELVPHIEGMIKRIIVKYYHGVEFMDMYQAGWVAVMKCVHNYNPDAGTKFTTYAYRAIENEMILYVNSQNKHKSKYDDDGNCLRGFIPLESQVSNKLYDGTYLSVKDTIPDTTQDIERESIIALSTPVIHEIAASFTNEKQKYMLVKYLQGISQQEIAEELSVTPAYVSNTIKVFNKKCQTKLNS